jgi:hypothetical protein
VAFSCRGLEFGVEDWWLVGWDMRTRRLGGAGCLQLPQPGRWEPGPRTDSASVTDVSTRKLNL